MVTNQSGQVVWMMDYQPFGKVAAGQTNSIEIYSRFPGQFYDAETGLYQNYFRDYDPSIGRYIESDPIGLGGGINTYSYVNGNPISMTDPLALAAMCYGVPVTFPHFWLCANGKCGGLVPKEGENEFGGQGYIRPQKPGLSSKGGDAAVCVETNEPNCDQKELDQCVENAINQQKGNLRYHLTKHQCYSWAIETYNSCKKSACSK